MDIRSLPLVGRALALVDDFLAIPAQLRQIAEAVAAFPRIEAQLAAIALDLEQLGTLRQGAADTQKSLGLLAEAVEELRAAVAGAAAAAGAAPSLEPVQNAADRVGQIAGRFPRMSRRFARPA